jgi:nucleoside-diphosphate-sugar epimerase
MKVLITGNMGYIGPSVVKQLRASYAESFIIGYDSGYFAGQLIGVDFLPECNVDVQYFGDVRDVPEHFLRDVDSIIHLAAISNDPMGKKYEEVTFDVNWRASIELAKKAKQAGVKSLVFASSCSTYGFADDSPRKEDSPLNPLTAYAKSKVYTERDLKELADKDFKITCLRFGTACGMSERLRLDLVLNDFVASAITSGRIVILSDGTPRRPLVHIKDMARAMDWAISRDLSLGGEYLVVNVGANEWNYQIKDLAGAVAKVLPGTDISINKDAAPDKRSYIVDFSLFKSLAPGHQPQYNLETTVLELKEGLESINFKERDFRNSNFVRLRVLDSLREKGLLDDKLRWTFRKV